MFMVFFALVPFEGGPSDLREELLWYLPVVMLIELLYSQWRARSLSPRAVLIRWGKRLLFAFLALTAFALASASIAATRGDDFPAAVTIGSKAFTQLAAFAFLLPMLWGIALEGTTKKEITPLARRARHFIWAALGCFLGWLLLSAIFSTNPALSFRYIHKELGVYCIAFGIIWIKASDPRVRGFWIGWSLCVGAVVALSGIVMTLVSYGWPETLGDHWVRAGNVLLHWDRNGDRVFRFQYPFHANNRAGSYLLCAMTLVPLLALRGRSQQRWGAVLCLLLMLGIFFSGTRGAMLAGIVIILWWLLPHPRIFGCIVAFLVAVILVLPGGLVRYMESIIDPAAVMHEDSSVQYRLTAYRISLEMIKDRPLLGVGYGWPNFEDWYPVYDPGCEEYKPHAHNNWLELTAESGLPAGLLFTFWQALLGWYALALLWRGRSQPDLRNRGLAIIVLLVALHLFGMTNYSLRRNVGFSVWMTLALAQLILFEALNSFPHKQKH